MPPIHLPKLPGILALVSILFVVGACDGPVEEEVLESPAPPARIVAIADVHGDLDAARAALRLGGAIDGEDRWIGGDLVVVQTGDILDRGDDEQAIMELFLRLGKEAEITGGAVHVLNGNHELMNA